MIPGSYDFLFFLLLSIFAVAFLQDKKSRLIILTVLSISYLSSFGTIAAGAFILIVLANYIISLGQKVNRNLFLTLGILFNITIFAIFSFPDIVTNYIPYDLGSVTPIGLSFMLFKNIAFQVDIRNMKSGFFDYLLYSIFFPVVTSGPILKFEKFQTSLGKDNKPSKFNYQVGIFKIVLGLFKKLVLATYLSDNLVAAVFQVPETKHPLLLLLGVYAFAIQIYMDFSGYSDIAIGSAKLLGINIDENFKEPYLATSIQDFWKRWHISLTEWLSKYIYIPLGGNRLGKFREILNTIIVMFVSAVWHGRSVNFLVWGGIHAIGLIFNKLFKFPQRANQKNRWVSVLLTFNIVAFSWVFFNISELNQALGYFERMFDFNTMLSTPLLLDINILIVFVISIVIHNYGRVFIEKISRATYKLRPIFNGILLGVLLLLIYILGPETVPDFIYYNF